MSVDDVLAEVAELAVPRVEVTGGEPLIQPTAFELLRRLCDAGFETLLETNGSQDISAVDPRVVRIVDLKCPSSGHADANVWANVPHLTNRDEVKFVLADRADYDFARDEPFSLYQQELYRWWLASAIGGPLLGLVGAYARRPGAAGLLAALTVPTGALLHTAVHPPGTGHQIVTPEMSVARGIVIVASSIVVGAAVVRFLSEQRR